LHTDIYTDIYQYIGIWRKEACVQCALLYPPLTAAGTDTYTDICRYIILGDVYSALFHTAADGSRHTDIYTDIYRYISRRVLSVHSSTPPLTAPGAYIYIEIYIAIYR
jgi:hypothetical protein